jgi:hypothetical protein
MEFRFIIELKEYSIEKSWKQLIIIETDEGGSQIVSSFILLKWFLLFFICFRESLISLLSNETDAGGS